MSSRHTTISRRRAAVPIATASLLAALVAPAMLVAPAHAQTRPHAAAQSPAPEVRSLQVDTDGALEPGSELRFELRGTPGGRANVRVNDGNTVVALHESSPGIYTGTHVVRRGERIDANGTLRATISANNRMTLRSYTFPPALVAMAQEAQRADPNFARPEGSQAQPRQVAAARIDRFTAQADGPLEPGAYIRFELHGVPGARARASIPGVINGLELRELNPGVYEGGYTVRRQDRLDAFPNASARLRLGNQVADARLAAPIAQAQREPPQTNTMGGPGHPAAEIINRGFEILNRR